MGIKNSLIKEWRASLDKKLTEVTITNELIKQANQELDDAKWELDCSREAQKVLQVVAKEVETKAHGHISRIVSKCLQMVFDDPYEFEIEFVEIRGKTEARMKFKKGKNKLSAMESIGGTVIDVASFALRLACLSLRLPKGRSFIAMDEPFKSVSSDVRPRIVAMLEMLASELGFQFVISTHMKALKTGTVYELE